MSSLELSPHGLTLENVVDVARNYLSVSLSIELLEKVKKSLAVIEKAVSEEKTVYGVTTGFGALSDKIIPKGDARSYR